MLNHRRLLLLLVSCAITIVATPPMAAQQPLPPPPLPLESDEPLALDDEMPFSETLALELMNQELKRLNNEKSQHMDDLSTAVKELQAVLNNRQQPPPASRPQPQRLPEMERNAPRLPQSQDVSVEEQPTPPKVTPEPPPTPQPKLPETAPVPINGILLADNLFASGEIEEALRSYTKLSEKSLHPKHRLWVMYQIACCQRRLGNVAEAMASYRELAGIPGDSIVPAKARWWIAALKRRREAEQRLAAIKFAIATMDQEQRDEPSP